jgi:Holliday junction resolvase RusA-like endonuclease
MPARSVRYIIPGDPIAWKRPAGKMVRYDSQKNLKMMWGLHIRNQHQGAYFEGPIHLDVLFAMPIPTGMSATKRQEAQGTWHIKFPDTSNMLKLIEDTAESIAYANDCIIAKVSAEKKYDLTPRIEFTLTELR